MFGSRSNLSPFTKDFHALGVSMETYTICATAVHRQLADIMLQEKKMKHYAIGPFKDYLAHTHLLSYLICLAWVMA